jgi:hypothetical protein
MHVQSVRGYNVVNITAKCRVGISPEGTAKKHRLPVSTAPGGVNPVAIVEAAASDIQTATLTERRGRKLQLFEQLAQRIPCLRITVTPSAKHGD